jgi:hypothetical protein
MSLLFPSSVFSLDELPVLSLRTQVPMLAAGLPVPIMENFMAGIS